MKHKHLVALMQDNYTTIQVAFRRDDYSRSKGYTYKCPLDAGIAVGDKVVVDSPANGLVVVEVLSIDKAPRIDLDADFTYKWIIQKVDMAAYEEREAKEEQAMDLLLEVERVRQREILLNEFQLRLPPGGAAESMFREAMTKLGATYEQSDSET